MNEKTRVNSQVSLSMQGRVLSLLIRPSSSRVGGRRGYSRAVGRRRVMGCVHYRHRIVIKNRRYIFGREFIGGVAD